MHSRASRIQSKWSKPCHAFSASAISFSVMAPSLMTFQYGSVISTVVAPAPSQLPASSTRSTRPSIMPNTSIPLRQVGIISGELMMTQTKTALVSAQRTEMKPQSSPIGTTGNRSDSQSRSVRGAASGSLRAAA